MVDEYRALQGNDTLTLVKLPANQRQWLQMAFQNKGEYSSAKPDLLRRDSITSWLRL